MKPKKQDCLRCEGRAEREEDHYYYYECKDCGCYWVEPVKEDNNAVSNRET
jgi:hypothetical protein